MNGNNRKSIRQRNAQLRNPPCAFPSTASSRQDGKSAFSEDVCHPVESPTLTTRRMKGRICGRSGDSPGVLLVSDAGLEQAREDDFAAGSWYAHHSLVIGCRRRTAHPQSDCVLPRAICTVLTQLSRWFGLGSSISLSMYFCGIDPLFSMA